MLHFLSFTTIDFYTCFRTHPLALHIREKEQSGDDFSTIKIGSLSQDNVKHLVAEALGMEGDEDELDTLSTIIPARRVGTPSLCE